ncbi:Mss4-like protein [Sordaria brevicollis]|uniref:Mss4-like protein n=1 Tax=Sordaria brevicollis TaxID=83679 RepID=A0AAE0UG15_SORBR|nr:Mss4-like protein [Sordaria brevicollis]
MEDITNGACLCEGVKFSVRGAPDNVFMCYCSHCTKNAGSVGQISAKFPRKNVQVLQGDNLLSTWVLHDNVSGCEKHKVFCSRCGCTMWTIPMKHRGDTYIVRTSLLDQGLEKFAYKTEFFASRKVAVAAPEVKSFPTMPGA